MSSSLYSFQSYCQTPSWLNNRCFSVCMRHLWWRLFVFTFSYLSPTYILPVLTYCIASELSDWSSGLGVYAGGLHWSIHIRPEIFIPVTAFVTSQPKTDITIKMITTHWTLREVFKWRRKNENSSVFDQRGVPHKEFLVLKNFSLDLDGDGGRSLVRVCLFSYPRPRRYHRQPGSQGKNWLWDCAAYLLMSSRLHLLLFTTMFHT